MGSSSRDEPLVGPGSELQLTLDGRAVPHREVVAGRLRERAPVPAPAARPLVDDGPLRGQTRLLPD